MSKIKYAVGLYSVRDELAMDMWSTLRTVKSMGYEGVEFFGRFTRTAQEIKAALEDTGLVCCGWHIPWEYLDESSIMATITYNKVMGNNNIVVPGLPKEMTCSREAWLNTAKEFDRVAKRLKDYGMRFGYHNHDTEFIPMDGEIPLYILLDNTGPDVGIQLDTGNALAGKANLMEIVEKYKDRLFNSIHLKPYSAENGGFHTMIGEDDTPWSDLMTRLKETGRVEWYMTEYEVPKYTQLEGIRLCLENLKDMENKGLF